MRTRSGQVLKDIPRVKKPHIKRAIPDEVDLGIKHVELEGDNPFERFESLLKKTNNFSIPITISDIVAIQGSHKFTAKQHKKAFLSNLMKQDMVQQGYDKAATFYDETPKFINGEMRDYQIAGLNWLLSLQKAGLNGVLADEMGLGKTLQSISLIAHNKFVENSTNPTIVMAPLSTIHNWKAEFTRFCPELKVLVVHGSLDERTALFRKEVKTQNYDVYIVSYETAIRLGQSLSHMHFNYVIIDEAQRIKNDKVALHRCAIKIQSNRRLLLTGTPFQNNIHELWSLLSYLVPAIFNDSEKFNEYFSDERLSADVEIVNRLHKILNPFLLRRIKSDVEKSLLPKKEYKIFMGMTELQKTWYTKVFTKRIETITHEGIRRSKDIHHIMMALREVANHPYMLPAAEPSGPPFITDETIVTSCGKMTVLDKMLKKFKEEGSRVLLFSQFTMMLDILEDYLMYRGIKYCRLDGDTDHEERHQLVTDFNAPGSETFIFLMSTRAGGLGINLATADVVIIYDSDWNPQMDFQAIDRAHRIGQKKQVRVFRLITRGTVDDYIVRTNEHKVRLQQTIIQDKDQLMLKAKSKEEMLEMISDTARRVETGDLETLGNINIDKLLEEAEKVVDEESRKKYEQMVKNDKYLVQNKQAYELYNFEEKNYHVVQKEREPDVYDARLRRNPKRTSFGDRAVSIREFWENYGLYYDKNDGKLFNYRFYPTEYLNLCNKKLEYMKTKNKILYDNFYTERTARGAKDLNEAEEVELDALRILAACNWTYLRFLTYINNFPAIHCFDHETLAGKINVPTDVVEKYSDILWERIDELPNAKEIKMQAKKFDENLEIVKGINEILLKKVGLYEDPLVQMTFNYGLLEWDEAFSRIEDRNIITLIQQEGYSMSVIDTSIMAKLKLKRPITEYPNTRGGAAMVKNRFQYLLKVIEMELENVDIEPKTEQKEQSEEDLGQENMDVD